MLLEIENVVKEYGNGSRANDGLSISCGRGQVFGLLGPNGAGKTTLVNQIVGLLTPTSGTIRLSGVDIVANPDYARKACSFQPQSTIPIEGFTPLQAIELIGRLRGQDAYTMRRRTRELVDMLEIGEWANKMGQHLSGGVRRLVGYCMAVVAPGDIVILDEPTNDIDPLRRRLLWRHIRAVADSGTAVLLVTHNVLEAERSVDQLAIIDKGKVLGSGTPASLKGSGAGDFRVELVLEPHASSPEMPPFMNAIRVGRRLRGTVDRRSVTSALEWAQALQERGEVEEFSISPASLEDVYVRMIGRPDALEAGSPGAANHNSEPGPGSRRR